MPRLDPPRRRIRATNKLFKNRPPKRARIKCMMLRDGLEVLQLQAARRTTRAMLWVRQVRRRSGDRRARRPRRCGAGDDARLARCVREVLRRRTRSIARCCYCYCCSVPEVLL